MQQTNEVFKTLILNNLSAPKFNYHNGTVLCKEFSFNQCQSSYVCTAYPTQEHVGKKEREWVSQLPFPFGAPVDDPEMLEDLERLEDEATIKQKTENIFIQSFKWLVYSTICIS